MADADKESSSVLAMADARAVAVDESTATLERHVSMPCFGTGNLNVWIRGVLIGGGMTSRERTGICMVLKTPSWSKNEVVRVVVPQIWWASCPGSQMARWSMHVAWLGWRGGVKAGVTTPSHLLDGRDWTWA